MLNLISVHDTIIQMFTKNTDVVNMIQVLISIEDQMLLRIYDTSNNLTSRMQS